MDELTLTPRKGAHSSSTPRKGVRSSSSPLIRTPTTRRRLLETSTPTQCADKHVCCDLLRQAGIKAQNSPLGKKWILTWGLVDSSQNVDNNNSPRSEISSISTSFQEVIMQKKKKADDETVESEPKKRRKIESKSRVVTSDEFTAEIEAKEREKQKKQK